ncbi:hypothetical protein BBO99_00008658 [Phytophthora kernoviae]|uniref:Uncharacterized protein n=1 Tax=Phytophthora kernoviae TaxID=325452 RepID=A0A3R7H6Q3_9STRA|nr:hypothetical protein JM16_008820 [Phytophthora kernoviae]RLN26750.1 hypothetical protein BBI17_004291 [Phytophthora kernoviae]RLN74930.1 hypothetical protein BBO99_00008658 [Phytophthora kernoviae]
MLPFAPVTTTSNTLTVSLGDGVDTSEEFKLAMELTDARNLITYALRATDDYFREQGAEPNASIFELLNLPEDFDSSSSQNMGMIEALEVDMSNILKSDFVFPRNFEDASDWTGVDGEYCERERGAFMDRVESAHLYSEQSLQPAYQSALFWLFQHGVVKQKLTQTTLAFDESEGYVDVTLSVPEPSATLTFVGCALLLVMGVLIFFGGKAREADVERYFKPHHLARVLLDDEAFSHRLLKCDLLNIGNKYLNSSELLDQFEISGLALRHRKRPSDVLIVPKAQQSTTASAVSSQPGHMLV